MIEARLVALADGDDRRNARVGGEAEQRLHLVGVEAEHRRGLVAVRFGGEQQVAEGDVALAGAPRLAMGIRIALGAQRSQVRWLVVRHGMRLTAAGLVLCTLGGAEAPAPIGRLPINL